jgi:taurine dioxygenase
LKPKRGEKILYANRGFTLAIANQLTALLSEIFNFAESRFVSEVRWELGDVIIWDNRFLAHCSGRCDGPEEPTLMHRISLQDGYPLCVSQMVRAAAE